MWKWAFNCSMLVFERGEGFFGPVKAKARTILGLLVVKRNQRTIHFLENTNKISK